MTKEKQQVVEVLITGEEIKQRHKERVDKIMADHGFESTDQLWEVPDELRALHLALAEDYRAQAGWTKPNRHAAVAEEESDDVAEIQDAEPEKEPENGVE